jgi:hypothetical protein
LKVEDAEANGRSRFPEGMTERKATAKATAKEEADPCGMTARKAKAAAKAKANTGVSPLRCASVEMTE